MNQHQCIKMTEYLYFLTTGIVLGLAAGITPGPLLTLVISETLQKNRKAGMITALAPAVTDLPIILVSFFILSKLSHSDIILGTISCSGALFIAYLAYENITTRHGKLPGSPRARSLQKGAITNLLSPHPYIFWMAVGSPIVLKASRAHYGLVICFVAGFYATLIGSKIAVAFLVEKYRNFINSRGYVYAIRIVGFILLIFAAIFLIDGLTFLGFIH